jgi:hypothetical protein
MRNWQRFSQEWKEGGGKINKRLKLLFEIPSKLLSIKYRKEFFMHEKPHHNCIIAA